MLYHYMKTMAVPAHSQDLAHHPAGSYLHGLYVRHLIPPAEVPAVLPVWTLGSASIHSMNLGTNFQEGTPQVICLLYGFWNPYVVWVLGLLPQRYLQIYTFWFGRWPSLARRRANDRKVQLELRGGSASKVCEYMPFGLFLKV